MSETLHIADGGKEEKYGLLYEQICALMEDEKDAIAVMANVSSMIAETFSFLWTGFYIVKQDMLVVGPFQGPMACTRIRFGKGVCGTAWKEARSLVVPDVEKFPGHIACSSLSRSEIVTPIVKDGQVVAVIDIDSDRLSCFDSTDRFWTEKIADRLSDIF